jgi:hypothetical protein
MKKLPAALMDKIICDLIAESRDDLVGLWEVVHEIQGHGISTGEALRENTLDVVRDLLRRGLVAGDPPYASGGYQPWADQRPDVVISRIRSEWIALGHIPNIPDIVWFSRPDHVS